MKIIGINASPRGSKSQTLRLVKAVLEGAREGGAETELVDLCKLDIKYCNACATCFATGRCVYDDDFDELYQKILGCDGLVLGSPNYFQTVTAQMKTLVDRMADAVHCQLLTGKYGCSVATAGSPASGEVTGYLNKILIGFGANVVGEAGASPRIPGEMEAAEEKAFALGESLVEAIREKKVYPEQEEVHREMREHFRRLVEMNKDLWTHEHEHWKRIG
ncbi:flavodoxin family protein [Methanothrix harundinacea]|uniref:Iron sulfur flavoprotein n=1 Tax=Methanothrix harundinacea (strain 6Ac) TaxID=1110509 RepID=G7WKY4_METH6|nr:flavodoxin family protein [Methanothrix harundinacea]AET64167.1 Iron sulfur flavoprotein [Methanothrix harundinacea 6Ac]